MGSLFDYRCIWYFEVVRMWFFMVSDDYGLSMFFCALALDCYQMKGGCASEISFFFVS